MNIRRYRTNDAPKISAFMRRCFVPKTPYETRAHSPEYYAWKYEPNPWGEPVVWVVEQEDRIAGLMAVVPKQLWINNELWYCGESGDTFMDPEAKGGNVFLDMADRVFSDCRRAEMQIIYGTPNRVSYDVVTQLFGYRELFTYRSLIRPLRFGPLIRTQLKNTLISNVLGWPVSLMHQGMYWPKSRGIQYRLEPVTKGDERLNAVWASMRHEVTCSLAKDRDYVLWRFINNPEDFHVMLVYRENEPVGYVVFKLTRMPGLLCGHVADLTVPARDADAPALWSVLFTELKKRQADFVNTWMIMEQTRTQRMKQFGFLTRKKPFWIVMREQARKLEDYPNLSDTSKWLFSQADTDNI